MEESAYQQADDLGDLFDDDDNNQEELINTYTPAASTPLPRVESGGNDELSALLAEAGGEPGFDLNELNERPLDVGEKAVDAQDYEDISLSEDENLPDDELPPGGQVLLPGLTEHAQGEINFDQPDGDDDLFGDSDGEATDSLPFLLEPPPPAAEDNEPDLPFDLASDHDDGDDQREPDVPEDMTAEEAELFRLQQMLFKGEFLPETAEQNIEQILKLQFPDYRKGETPYFNRLFPPRPGKYPHAAQVPKRKPIRPTKVSLDIEQDQKMLFSSTSTNDAQALRPGLVPAHLPIAEAVDEESSDESDLEEPLPGGVTMQELEFLCADFDTLSAIAGSDAEMDDLYTRAAESDVEMFGTEGFNDFEQPRKKRRLGMDAHDIVSIHQLDLPFFDDPERMTAKLSQKVVLDLNDTDLLLEEVDPESFKTKLKPGEKAKGSITVKNRLDDRFKISNDAEYDLLKQNHQRKIRGQLGHLTIDHSAPALRLQYPYYQVKRDIQDLRNHHRRKMVFKYPISFAKAAKHKRKLFKGKEYKDIYATTKDLSIADNSTAVLLEYSEENPTTMSQPGMGSKIVNYYRRRTREDTFRPKRELGETSVLLPEDKSPFYMFGHIDSGEEMTALYNSMYRAPIFEQKMPAQDFLVVRESTGMGGQHHYMRNVDHLFVVGQEFPSTLVPGTHSRMVTTASKNRLKAISYRIARRRKTHRIRVEDVTKHFSGSTDMQNRQKMKEFMFFNKEFKEWEMKNGEAVPDEEAIRGLIRPEDVCLLESMQVGDQYLHDAGYGSDDDEEKDQDNEADSIEQLLAPWRTTKTFILATQGKAMLRVWGDGDTSGIDEALSLIKTNMKGGYRPRGAPITDLIAKGKNAGGHSYNVANQQMFYERDIRDTWEKQRAALGSKIEPGDPDMDGDIDTREDLHEKTSQRATPISTPAPVRHHDYETGTSFSKRSVGSQAAKYLKIVRTVIEDGGEVEKTYIETDPVVIKAYVKAKQKEEENLDPTTLQPTGNAEFDARQKKRMEKRLAQLQANQARRQKRQSNKANAQNAADPDGPMSPDGDAPTPAPTGKQQQATQRKCANCGQVGHIKTNKKSVDDKCSFCRLPFDRMVISAFTGGVPASEEWY